ncbi:DUF262 domain-containing protein [Acinetobacter sp. C_4_1]|uniref:DUF262 domain-containing protein n=1 Tax=unclassified Acinetobacter TaxID=196816 RepID=UPI0021B8277C|nr:MULTISPECIES: DUF262 domain-containing protein [unclassified Acinetobacter]MCT8088781.1 DUF262 domain-containing protein [Acinetobacter sp. F_3_1]MCT8096937.1 DUF262 domain-containing protein [Acinetobacter sp. C_3_1]MCT8100070.1 DUF262 domain-containing protein [Acinetobacter sp. C_4_1]MCT8134467.1 DUF262 domain-containing protein [Acinetobacter sp. T_3_1]
MQLSGAILRNFWGIGSLVTQESITDYFSLKVPHYQRPYKWGVSQIETLIRDWKENIIEGQDDNDKKYFAGSVVAVATPGESFHSLIDGQQRVTTLFLTNFINFVILRKLILSEVERKRCGKLQKLNEKLENAAQFLFKDNEILLEIKQGIHELNKISDEDEMAELHEQEGALEKIQEILWIPKYDTEDNYKNKFKELMCKKIKNDSLNLHYDRSSFNKSLSKVLSQFYINFGDTQELKYENLEYDILTENEKVYADALKVILTTFQNEFKNNGEDIYKYIYSLHEKIHNFLKEVNVCVIQTMNTDDAYTLFEVMNDRALALDDLDLIKNQFFKKFVNTNANIDNSKMDEIIQKLDDQWGDKIFHHKNMNQTYKKLVTYLATVYITKSTELRNESSEKYRLNLANYLKMDNYTQDDIQRDFNIFEACFQILKLTNLPVQRKENHSIIAQYENQSEFKKSLYLFNALKQDGVMSGLINFTLFTIENIDSNFNPDKVVKIIKLLLESSLDKNKVMLDLDLDEKEASEVLEKLNNIHKQAKVLWRSSLMANSAELPREMAKSIIEDNHLLSQRDHGLVIKELDLIKHQTEFEKWLNTWQYEPGPLFKVKTLFASIIQYSLKDDGTLTIKPIKLNVSSNTTGLMELDHMVARNLDGSSVFNFDHTERDIFVNGLGNMMPLPKVDNIHKSNESLETAFKYYEAAGLDGHFLIKHAKEAVMEVVAQKKRPEDFFTERKTNLINYFKQIV